MLRRPEIEKCAAVPLPDYLRAYLQEVLEDVRTLNERIELGEKLVLRKIDD